MWKWILGGAVAMFLLTRKVSTSPTAGTLPGPTTAEADQLAIATKSAAIINYAQQYYSQVQGMEITFAIELSDSLYHLVDQESKSSFASAKSLDELETQIKANWALSGWY